MLSYHPGTPTKVILSDDSKTIVQTKSTRRILATHKKLSVFDPASLVWPIVVPIIYVTQGVQCTCFKATTLGGRTEHRERET
jgi:hypothetical protein